MNAQRTKAKVLSFLFHKKSKRKVVLITGCSSGIGYELAKQLYDRTDLNVIATCRNKSLADIQKNFPDTERYIVRELDILDELNIYSLVHEIQEKWGRIDVIVNNAAVCYRGVVEHMDNLSEELQLKTNYLGPMTLTRAVLPVMREQRSGHVINVSSVSGMLSMPTMGSYSASKHALEGASEALWYEAKPMGIKVNLVQLGFVNSASHKKVVLAPKAKISQMLSGPHSEYYRSMVPLIEKFMSYSFSSPEKIARRIIKIIEKPKSYLRIPLTFDAIVFSLLKKIIPSYLLQRFLYVLIPKSSTWGGRWSVEKALKNDFYKKAD